MARQFGAPRSAGLVRSAKSPGDRARTELRRRATHGCDRQRVARRLSNTRSRPRTGDRARDLRGRSRARHRLRVAAGQLRVGRAEDPHAGAGARRPARHLSGPCGSDRRGDRAVRSTRPGRDRRRPRDLRCVLARRELRRGRHGRSTATAQAGRAWPCGVVRVHHCVHRRGAGVRPRGRTRRGFGAPRRCVRLRDRCHQSSAPGHSTVGEPNLGVSGRQRGSNGCSARRRGGDGSDRCRPGRS